MLKYKKIRQFAKRINTSAAAVLVGLSLAAGIIVAPATVLAAKYYCGSGAQKVETSIDFGCYGTSCTKAGAPAYCNADRSGLIDLLFAIIRFLSAGVGIVVIGSVVFAGIQYTTSRGDPQQSAAAIKRIRNTVIALGIYIFAYAILNYLIPAGFFQ
jgi:hypothetical protein